MDNPAFYRVLGIALVQQELLENHPDSALRLLDVMQAPVVNAYGRGHQLYTSLETQYSACWQLKDDAARTLLHLQAAFEGIQNSMAGNFSYMSMEEREKFARVFEQYRDVL